MRHVVIKTCLRNYHDTLGYTYARSSDYFIDELCKSLTECLQIRTRSHLMEAGLAISSQLLNNLPSAYADTALLQNISA